MQGVETFLKGLWQYTESGQYGDEFGARVYKISRDEQGNRLTHLKVTGGRCRRDSYYRAKSSCSLMTAMKSRSGAKRSIRSGSIPEKNIRRQRKLKREKFVRLPVCPIRIRERGLALWNTMKFQY